MVLVSAVLETLGVGIIIPILVVTTQSDLAVRYPSLGFWLDRLGNPSQEQLVVAAMVTLIVVYALKAFFLAFLAWRQARFAFRLRLDLTERLFTGYLHQPYTFYLQRNSAELILNIGQASEIADMIQQVLNLTAEILVLFCISVMLLAAEPLGTVVVACTLGLASWTFNHFTHNHILRWGKAARLHHVRRIQHLQQGLGAAKDVKLLGREEGFLGQFRLDNFGLAKASQHAAVLSALPRLWLELLVVSGFAALVLVMIGQGKPFDALVPTLGLFAAAAFRLMPSVNRVIGFVQNVRFSLPVIDVVSNELGFVNTTVVPQRGELVQFNQMLTLDQISFKYPGAEVGVLQRVSLSIPQGTSVGFIGGSGAGKSTLVDIILGLLTPDSGTVRVDGVDIQSNLRGWQDQIGYVPQSIFLTDDTIRRNVAFGIPDGQIDESAVRRTIRAAQLEQFVNDLPLGLDTFVGERGIRLSGGQRQRIGIARALYHNPSVLVMDEATSSLDLVTEGGVLDAVRALQGEKTILIVAHRLSTIEYCDRRYRLESGRVVEEEIAGTMLQDEPCSIVTEAMPKQRSRSHEAVPQEPLVKVESPERAGSAARRCDPQ